MTSRFEPTFRRRTYVVSYLHRCRRRSSDTDAETGRAEPGGRPSDHRTKSGRWAQGHERSAISRVGPDSRRREEGGGERRRTPGPGESGNPAGTRVGSVGGNGAGAAGPNGRSNSSLSGSD